MKQIRKTIHSMKHMSTPARTIIKLCLVISCISLAAALLYLVYLGEFTACTYRQHHLVKELLTMPQALILLTGITSVILEEKAKT